MAAEREPGSPTGLAPEWDFVVTWFHSFGNGFVQVIKRRECSIDQVMNHPVRYNLHGSFHVPLVTPKLNG